MQKQNIKKEIDKNCLLLDKELDKEKRKNIIKKIESLLSNLDENIIKLKIQ